jgi:DNA-binding response OmpR family regulator
MECPISVAILAQFFLQLRDTSIPGAIVMKILLIKVHGMEVKIAVSTLEAEARLEEWEPDIVVTDWLYEKESTLQWIGNISKNNNRLKLPVMMISEQDTIKDRQKALVNGVDEYLVKPFSLAELKLRLELLARRFQVQALTLRVSAK